MPPIRLAVIGSGHQAMTASVLIASYRRPRQLAACLEALARQQAAPEEIIVIWQGDDAATARAAEPFTSQLGGRLILCHSPEVGVVPAENQGLRRARGEVVLLIDDDAVPEPFWIERHLSHYQAPQVGAVGGPCRNRTLAGQAFPVRHQLPVSRLTWYGRVLGNTYDLPDAWRAWPPQPVQHLVGNNMSFRRSAVAGFETHLRPYWQNFELDACLQVQARGLQVIFDFANCVTHYPTNTAFSGGRSGDLELKILNPAFNHALILAKWSSGLQRAPRFLYAFLVGTGAAPGPLLLPLTLRRHGQFRREWRLASQVWRSRWQGWRLGQSLRRAARGSSGEPR